MPRRDVSQAARDDTNHYVKESLNWLVEPVLSYELFERTDSRKWAGLPFAKHVNQLVHYTTTV